MIDETYKFEPEELIFYLRKKIILNHKSLIHKKKKSNNAIQRKNCSKF